MFPLQSQMSWKSNTQKGQQRFFNFLSDPTDLFSIAESHYPLIGSSELLQIRRYADLTSIIFLGLKEHIGSIIYIVFFLDFGRETKKNTQQWKELEFFVLFPVAHCSRPNSSQFKSLEICPLAFLNFIKLIDGRIFMLYDCEMIGQIVTIFRSRRKNSQFLSHKMLLSKAFTKLGNFVFMALKAVKFSVGLFSHKKLRIFFHTS